MKIKRLKRMELWGVPITFLIWYALHRTNSLESDHLINLLFGSVNKSSWEMVKTLLLACAFWSVIELFCARPYFKAFVSAKTFSLYITGIVYCCIMTVFRINSAELGMLFESTAIIIASALFHILSFLIFTRFENLSGFYMPCVFLLLLFAVIYVCFTPFPPQNPLFYDYENGFYGIISPYADCGAYVLDRLYGI
ncbi:MAG: DUF6512 family protein [bacterium]|nr:DUF6512 family protein [bacterium]MDY3861263.1 DUF6512 family protein [Ruminococcus sp.]